MRRRPRFLALTLALAAIPAFAQEKADEIVEPGPAAARGKVLEWKSAAGQPYWYHLPKSLDPKKPTNLLLMLHGTGVKHGWAFWNYPIASGQFRKDDIVVAPEGVTPGAGGSFNFVQGKPDGEQLAGIIRQFRKAFTVGRVVLYGHSQGAFFCYWFAGEYPELVDGFVAHAGNVLDVKHPPLAKQKIAVGILHGKADAVVPVDCAFRTEGIYKEQGYAKLRLEVVDGLTPESGHWPLPNQVAGMLAWVDRVSTSNPADAVLAAEALLAAEPFEIGPYGDAVIHAEGVLKRTKEKVDDATKTTLVKLRFALDGVVKLAAARLGEITPKEATSPSSKAPFGPWAAFFLVADEAFGDHPLWLPAAKPHRALAARHGKVVDAALKALGRPDKKSLADALTALRDASLAPRRTELEVQLARHAASPPKDAPAGFADSVTALLAERKKALEDASTDLQGMAGAAKTLGGLGR